MSQAGRSRTKRTFSALGQETQTCWRRVVTEERRPDGSRITHREDQKTQVTRTALLQLSTQQLKRRLGAEEATRLVDMESFLSRRNARPCSLREHWQLPWRDCLRLHLAAWHALRQRALPLFDFVDKEGSAAGCVRFVPGTSARRVRWAATLLRWARQEQLQPLVDALHHVHVALQCFDILVTRDQDLQCDSFEVLRQVVAGQLPKVDLATPEAFDFTLQFMRADFAPLQQELLNEQIAERLLRNVPVFASLELFAWGIELEDDIALVPHLSDTFSFQSARRQKGCARLSLELDGDDEQQRLVPRLFRHVTLPLEVLVRWLASDEALPVRELSLPRLYAALAEARCQIKDFEQTCLLARGGERIPARLLSQPEFARLASDVDTALGCADDFTPQPEALAG